MVLNKTSTQRYLMSKGLHSLEPLSFFLLLLSLYAGTFVRPSFIPFNGNSTCTDSKLSNLELIEVPITMNVFFVKKEYWPIP